VKVILLFVKGGVEIRFASQCSLDALTATSREK